YAAGGEGAKLDHYLNRFRLSNVSLFDSFLQQSPKQIKLSRKRLFMKVRLLLFIAIIISISTITAISFAQRTRDTDKPINGDFKITIKNNRAGNTSQSTTMIKGSRQRDETSMAMGQSQINITQCDLKRTIQINDSARKYMITSLATDESDTTGGGAGHAAGAGTDQRGGVVTMTVNTVDTGERK